MEQLKIKALALLKQITPDKVVLVLSMIVLTALLIQIINQIIGYNFLKPNLIIQQQRRENYLKFHKTLASKLHTLLKKFIYWKNTHGFDLYNKYQKDAINIVLERNNKKLFKDEDAVMTCDEYVAVRNLKVIFIIIIGIVLVIYMPKQRYIWMVICGLLIFYVQVMEYNMMKSEVETQNNIFKKYFGDFFLTQYHIIRENHKKPLSTGLEVYQYKSKNDYMTSWIKYTLKLIKSSSEAQVIKHYKILYGDIKVLRTLFTIQEQLLYGGDENAEEALKGLREQVINDKNNAIQEKVRTTIEATNIISFSVVFVLIQSCIGAVFYVLVYGGAK